MIKKIFVILLMVFCTSVTSQISESFSKADTLNGILTDTTLKAMDTILSDSSIEKSSQPDSLQILNTQTQSLQIPDTSAAKKSGTLKVSKKKYNHREQIVFASIMMAFIAIVISSAQNWNPD